LTITTFAISLLSLHKEFESKEIHITTTRKITPRIATKEFFPMIARRTAFYKNRYKKDSLQILLQDFFARIIARRIS
jgi:hypothetical protein